MYIIAMDKFGGQNTDFEAHPAKQPRPNPVANAGKVRVPRVGPETRMLSNAVPRIGAENLRAVPCSESKKSRVGDSAHRCAKNHTANGESPRLPAPKRETGKKDNTWSTNCWVRTGSVALPRSWYQEWKPRG